MVPEINYREVINTIKIDDTALTFFQKSVFYLIYKVAVQVCAAPAVPPPSTGSVGSDGPPGKGKSVEGRKIKASNLIDPTDESEFCAA